jgi:thiosulfate/3-mercaptopyruvate sulfurtransferase
MAGYAHPDALVDTQWVADHLRDPTVRVVEVDVNRQAYDGGHVPGAVLWVVYEDLLDPDWRLKDDPAEIAALLARSSIAADTTVVFYSGATNANMPATFGYWLLAAWGHHGARIMDGGRKKWLAEGRPLEGAPPTIAPCPARPQAPDWRHRARRDLVEGSLGGTTWRWSTCATPGSMPGSCSRRGRRPSPASARATSPARCISPTRSR